MEGAKGNGVVEIEKVLEALRSLDPHLCLRRQGVHLDI